MPPKKDLCRNFQRGSCHYGARCKFVHASQINSNKPNAFGFGTQTTSQFQHNTNSQQQKPNPFGFGVQNNNSQPNGFSDFGSKQNQAKPFENKWSRNSAPNGSTSVSRQTDKQPTAPNHDCKDPQSCKSQIIEDSNERPVWKLTCYGHRKDGPCDIRGDISYEELRAVAYDDAKRGVPLQSIVEKERDLLNSKLHEFEALVRNPVTAVHQDANISTQNPFSAPTPNLSSPFTGQNHVTPAVSAFGQTVNPGFGIRPSVPNNFFGQQNSFQFPAPTATNGLSSKNAGSFNNPLPVQPFGNTINLNTSNIGNSGEGNPFSTQQIAGPTNNQSPLSNMSTTSTNKNVVDFTHNVRLNVDTPDENHGKDKAVIWSKEWNPGEIPEEAPPDEFIV